MIPTKNSNFLHRLLFSSSDHSIYFFYRVRVQKLQDKRNILQAIPWQNFAFVYCAGIIINDIPARLRYKRDHDSRTERNNSAIHGPVSGYRRRRSEPRGDRRCRRHCVVVHGCDLFALQDQSEGIQVHVVLDATHSNWRGLPHGDSYTKNRHVHRWGRWPLCSGEQWWFFRITPRSAWQCVCAPIYFAAFEKGAK